ncbi:MULTISPECIES: ABC transporter permease [unclassified Bacillus (in: firmicutes)]|uniref:ABC transporter permease n=1 Tax=unclassified Bacillus (in: firmicutes) TaxID=185979 RepID=UPI00080AEB5A|nr:MULTISPECIES: ABC transporter permease [unclassified Bacillus (in: firmicutes)]OCA84653.1 teichoic acid ABC transporter permease [Bacillus sp. FJAT-27986]
MKSMFTVIQEQIRSFYLIKRLSVFELKSANNSNYLGIMWEFLNPLIQIGVYWVVFGMGIRGGREIGDVPFIYWMLSGISLWFFANPAIMDGTKSIYTRINFISKMSFPMSAIPSYVIMSKFYQHIVIVIIVSIILQFGGFPISLYYLQLPYFMIAAIILFFAVTLVTSTLATIVRDVVMIVQAIMRMLIYLTPILWVSNSLPGFLQMIIKFNPLTYLVEGYRAAMLGQSWYFIEHADYTLYFWGVTIVLLMIGSALHLKFRNHFVDYL